MAESKERKQAHVDRIEDGNQAVLIVGDLEYELVVPVDELPDGIAGGDWMQIAMEDGKIVEATIDHEAKAAARERISEKMSRLRSRGRANRDRK